MGLHADLIALGERWLRAQGCDLVLAEPATASGERPDVIGWHRSGALSTVIEAKVTRKDLTQEWSFTHKSRKPFRRTAAAGSRRYYLAPAGVVPDALLDATGWGLLTPRGGLIQVARISKQFEVNFQSELQILVRAASDPKYGKQRPFQVELPFQAAANGAGRR